MIELIGVSKCYGDVEALRDVSFTVKDGEVLTVVGPNGSGKTTLLKILGALETPSEGKVIFDGSRLDESNAAIARRKATMVFQRTILLRGSVRDNVAYGLRLRNIPVEEVNHRVEEALDLVGLADLGDRLARSLSGGEQQRLSLARGFVLNCKLLLLDEPTANLDPESLSIVKGAITRLNKETDTTIVMATHNLRQAEELSERIVLLDMGKVVEMGQPLDLFRSPSALMARFARSENVFTGDSNLVEGVYHVDIGEDVVIRGASGREGRVTIRVRPEDIILSRRKMVSSARNTLKGHIISVEGRGDVVRLKVNAGKVFTVQITRRSLVEMGLNVGEEVCLTFKASSVQVI